MKLVILAAGQGKRLGCESSLMPKVLREVCGKSLLQYVLDAARFVPEEDVWAVVGFQKQKIIREFPRLNYACQEKRLGTGHAVICALEAMGGCKDDVMVVNGDTPLFRAETFAYIAASHAKSGADCTVAAFEVRGEIPPFGHIIQDSGGLVRAIVEHKDATEEQKRIRLLNAGLYVFRGESLAKALPKMRKSPVSGEYYITELPAILAAEGGKTLVCPLPDESEALGVNTAEDLAVVEAVLKKRKSKKNFGKAGIKFDSQ